MDPKTKHEFDLMVSDNVKARAPYRATGPVWPELTRIFRQRLQTRTVIEDFNSSFASYPRHDRHYEYYARHMGITTTTGDWYVKACDAYEDLIRQRDTQGVMQRVTVPRTWDSLLSIDEVISIAQAVPRLLTDHVVIVDLGSGWGRIGQALRMVNPNVAYIACDIPESLIIAQDQLPNLAPGPSHPYSECRLTKRFDRQALSPGLWFCGSHDLDRFETSSVDVFTNVFSFQEMTCKQVVSYFEVIDRVTKGGFFYTQQRIVGDELTRDSYPYHTSWEPAFDRDVAFSPGYFEAGFRVQ